MNDCPDCDDKVLFTCYECEEEYELPNWTIKCPFCGSYNIEEIEL